MNEIPTSPLAFKAWRERQKFTGDLASLASMREMDLKILERIDGLLPPERFVQLRADIEKTRRAFEIAYAARHDYRLAANTAYAGGERA